ncbi:CBS domain-containing protein [Streptomyces sp. NBC_01314]|uniref:CBS domain-containing protein n=1 Tax=Streptomyces sp. NBC_01314 TaxID=2903821 RepID=UPI00308C730F|nr:CBS domain-containing protein [Streptomyces sp. NBC_01314]
MSARELAEPYPYVTTDEDAAQALRLLALHRLPALLVVDADAKPYAVVPCAQLVGRLLPGYTRESPPITAVSGGGKAGGEVRRQVEGLTVEELLPPCSLEPPTVGPDASATQIAALMARTGCPLVVVVEHDGDQAWLAGAVTAARLLRQLVE